MQAWGDGKSKGEMKRDCGLGRGLYRVRGEQVVVESVEILVSGHMTTRCSTRTSGTVSTDPNYQNHEYCKSLRQTSVVTHRAGLRHMY
jgi:hypothetical protein